MEEVVVKDAAPDDVFYLTWLVECVEYDDNGDQFMPVFHETIKQDYYNQNADYILKQDINDKKLISQIQPLWSLEQSGGLPNYSIINSYLKELAIKYTHKLCVRYGTKDIHQYFERWINHTVSLLSLDGDRLSFIVFKYDIDNLVRQFSYNLKLYTMIQLLPDEAQNPQLVRIRLKDFFIDDDQNMSRLTEVASTNVKPMFKSVKFEKFDSIMKQNMFYDLERVKCLDEYKRMRLVDLIVTYDTPSAIAMLYHLGLQRELTVVQDLTKEKFYALVANSLGVSHRTVKGNFLTVSNSFSKEDAYKYPAREKLSLVKEDYEDILMT